MAKILRWFYHNLMIQVLFWLFFNYIKLLLYFVLFSENRLLLYIFAPIHTFTHTHTHRSRRVLLIHNTIRTCKTLRPSYFTSSPTHRSPRFHEPIYVCAGGAILQKRSAMIIYRNSLTTKHNMRIHQNPPWARFRRNPCVHNITNGTGFEHL